MTNTSYITPGSIPDNVIEVWSPDTMLDAAVLRLEVRGHQRISTELAGGFGALQLTRTDVSDA
jgi:hypothetical protein